MATHDYVIANGTGSAVRSDLNNALAAIVSNNSSSSEPATKYAYQWWADTTTGQLKLRNSANNGWVTFFGLDGTILMGEGSAASPGLAFSTDTNTGIFTSAADKIGFATGGVERLEIGSSEVVFNDPSNDVDFRVESNGQTHMLFVDGGNDRVGIGTSSPTKKLEIHDGSGTSAQVVKINSGGVGLLTIQSGTTYESRIEFGSSDNDDAGYIYYDNDDDVMKFGINGSERLRVDSSGRLLVGATTAPNLNNAGGASSRYPANLFYNTASDSDKRFTAAFIGGATSASGALLRLGKTRGTSPTTATIVQSGDEIATIDFVGTDGTQYVQAAEITCEVDGTPGTNDMPGRLTFSTTPDGSSSATERMRISSGGSVFINRTTAVNAEKFSVGNDGQVAYFRCTVNANHDNIQMSHSYATGGQTATQISIQNAALSQVGSIKSTASSTSFNTSSDYRLKENVIDIADGIARVKQLLPKRFNFIVNADKTVDGFLAHEAQAVVPEAVTGEKDGEEMQGIDQSKLVPLLTAALQEAITKIETLETKVAALEAG
jgi:hypothetical protein